MTGIQAIASYIPDRKLSNYDRKGFFGIDDTFIEERIGVKRVAVKDDGEETSDLCVKAFQRLLHKVQFDPREVKAIVVVTQNPDYAIPHTSAIVHGKLNLPEDCACFDISLGCSGYVYGLSVIQSFMSANAVTKGLLFTADPYSKIVDRADKNTALLFGDAATVTLISDAPTFATGAFTFGTCGKEYKELLCANQKLSMNGRDVFNFSAQRVPADILAVCEKNHLSVGQIDAFVLHQGSKYIVDTITKRLNLEAAKVMYDAYEYGNTVSSSIPIILEKELLGENRETILISGFGVGLSWASGILRKI